jgi:hypothetical protein
VLEAHGFEVSFIRGIDLGRFQSDGRTGDALSQRLGWRLRWATLVAMDRLLPARSLRGHRFRYLLGDGPHLCALVKVAPRAEVART